MRSLDGGWEKFEDYVLDFALDCIQSNQRIALVTLVKIEGSSPRSLGAQMAVSETGNWVGYLSGGCLERAVVAEAIAAIENNENRRVRYGKGSRYIDVQLPCGSAIELVFDVHLSAKTLIAVQARLDARLPASLIIPAELGSETTVAITRSYQPRRKLIVAGVGPAAVHLARLGHLSRFQAILHSPDAATLDSAKANGLATASIDSIHAIPEFDADAQSAIVFMFHDHEWEKRLIPAALNSRAFYIGALGSRRTHRLRLEMLAGLGIDSIQMQRVRGPAGIFSGAKSAPDVALSILAEIVQFERAANQRSLDLVETGSTTSDCKQCA